MKKSIAIGTVIFLTVILTPFVLLAATWKGGSLVDQPGTKEKKVKVLVRENGKLVEKDSTITKTNKGVMVVGKQMTLLADSLYAGVGDDLQKKVVTVTVTDDEAASGQPKSFTYTIGDSLRQDVARKVIRLDGGKKVLIMQNEGKDEFELSPAASNGAGTKVFHVVRDPFSFRANDPNIVSYKKKDLGKGLEKITIIRKKVN